MRLPYILALWLTSGLQISNLESLNLGLLMWQTVERIDLVHLVDSRVGRFQGVPGVQPAHHPRDFRELFLSVSGDLTFYTKPINQLTYYSLR